MGRPSKLADRQWEEIGKRLLLNEPAASLSREYGVSKGAISQRFSKRNETVKNVANQIVETNKSLAKLNVSEQIAALDHASRIQAIQDSYLTAAGYGMATSARLHGIANMKVQEVSDCEPLSAESKDALTEIAAITKIANEAGQLGERMLNANRDSLRPAPQEIPDGLGHFYGE